MLGKVVRHSQIKLSLVLLFAILATGMLPVPSEGNLPANSFVVLNPQTQTSPLVVQSLEDGNVIRAGNTELALDKYEFGSISDSNDLAPGQIIEGDGAFTLGSEGNALDLPVPVAFSSTQFVVPHIRSSHLLLMFSPSGDANVTV